MYSILLLLCVGVSALVGATITWDTPGHVILCIVTAILLGFAPQGIMSTFGDSW